MMNSPKEIANNYVKIGTGKARLPLDKMLLLAIMAGMFIALGGVACTTVSCTVENGSIGKLLGAAVFPAGLAMVLLAGSELFTGNCLLVLPWLNKSITTKELLRDWVVVYLGNFIGALIVSALVVYGHTINMFGGVEGQAMISTAASKCAITFTDGLFRGILCNILVCIAVWVAFAAKDAGGKIVVIFLPILIFVAAGYEHSVANMYFISAGLFAKSVTGADVPGLTWSAFLIKNLIPVTIGNIIGGGFPAAVYWYVYVKDENK